MLFMLSYGFNISFRGFGLDEDNTKDTVQRMADKAKDAASKSTDAMNSAAEGKYSLVPWYQMTTL